jgi:hypothetical protein
LGPASIIGISAEPKLLGLGRGYFSLPGGDHRGDYRVPFHPVPRDFLEGGARSPAMAAWHVCGPMAKNWLGVIVDIEADEAVS